MTLYVCGVVLTWLLHVGYVMGTCRRRGMLMWRVAHMQVACCMSIYVQFRTGESGGVTARVTSVSAAYLDVYMDACHVVSSCFCVLGVVGQTVERQWIVCW